MLRWRKVAVIIRREYLSRVTARAFWISTVAVPLLMLAMLVLPNVLTARSGGSFTVTLVTSSPELAREVARLLAARPAAEKAFGGGSVQITLRILAPAADAGAQRAALKRDILAKRLNAVVFLPETILADGQPEYVSTNVAAFRLMIGLERAIEAAVLHVRLAGAGVAPGRVEALTKKVSMRTTRISEDLEESSEDASERSFVLSYVLTLLLYLTVTFYGYYVMRGVLEEKTSRIVEVIVGSIAPSELMLGKIVGIGAVGLTQYAIWIFVLVNLTLPGLLGAQLGGGVLLGSPWLLFFFALFFVLGYFLWASVYAALGSAFNTEEEAQQMQSVVGLLMALPMVLMFPVISNPDSTLAVVLSLIPFLSPVLFFLRMTVQFPPAWQIVLAIVLLVGSVFAVARVAGAVYRVGILMYGKKPTFREIMRWVRSS
jgi:ABC-2 type transport system permease protein